ncbi:MAG: ABC transporter permease [Gammaproteobacteria bacterium]|nr:ABC transporter permease [Gammaproteobacteria bacterium]
MTGFIVRRLIQSGGVILTMTVVVFLGVYAIGNPVDILIPDDATAAERDLAIRSLGLDKPLLVQYTTFLSNLLRGDLGTSFVYNIPSIDLILLRLPATLELALCALFIAIVIGLPLGLMCGLRPGSRLDRVVMGASIVGFSIPNFWQGLMLIMLFSVMLGWLPSTGRGEVGLLFGIETSLATWDGISHLLLPAINLSLYKLSLMIRLTRSGVREIMYLDYVRFARAKGLSEQRIVLVHIMKVVLVPIITVVGMEFGSLIAFATVTETIFAWPGMGKLIIDSIMRLDRPVIAGYLVVIVLLFVLINLVVDIAYSLLDPRIRLGGRTE